MKKRGLSVLCAVAALSLNVQPVCADSAWVFTDGETEDGYYYSEYEAEQQGTHKLTVGEQGCFSCEWNGVFNYRAEVGRQFQTNRSFRNFNDMVFQYEMQINPRGNCWYGLHAKFADQPELFIVDGWSMWRPPGGQGLLGFGYANGKRYDYYQSTRYNQPGVEGTQLVTELWAVAQNSSTQPNRTNRVFGEISISQHLCQLAKQESAYSAVYDSQLQYAALFTEGYGSYGGDSSCNLTVTKNKVYQQPHPNPIPDPVLPEPEVTTASVQTVPAVTTTTEPKLPADANGVFFREDFERGRGDWAKRAHEDDTTVLMPDTANYAEGQQSLHLTERSESWNGAQISLDPYEIEPGKAYSFQAAVMQNSAPGQTVKMLLEYTDSSGTKQYGLIAQAECRQNAWTVLRNADYVIPADSTERKLVLHTGEGIDDFWIDSVTVAEAGKGAPIDLSGAKPASVSEQKTGDANCDGVVDVSDAVLVMRYAVADREAVLTDQGIQNADCDRNGNTDNEDATLILQHIAKKINLNGDGLVVFIPDYFTDAHDNNQ